ncbi:ABC transporter permease subunit [Spirillospora sp. CA-294931]|uniref:ABC transporter permease subunit n=1 Tax=Spirillospora sp. CA-294931 TaxID=3240042 RepID=UPI003D8F6C6A
MIWLSLRQFRVQGLVGLGAVAVIALSMLVLGNDVRDGYDAYKSACTGAGECVRAKSQFRSEYENTLLFLAAGLALVPAVIGTFWGAPLVARELEAGTHRLAWNQSVTRRRWLLTKVLIVGLAAALVSGVAGALLTWAASPFDQVVDTRFSAFVFGARGIVPVGYAVFAFAFGTVTGLVLKKSLPAMAVTLVGFLVFQFAVPNLVRPNLIPPERTTLKLTAQTINEAQNLGSIGGGAVINGLPVPGEPGAWVAGTSQMRTRDGKTLSGGTFNTCVNNPPKTGAGGTFGDAAVCLGRLDLHVEIAYHPRGRYWTFQALETSLYLAASALFVLIGLWRIRRQAS